MHITTWLQGIIHIFSGHAWRKCLRIIDISKWFSADAPIQLPGYHTHYVTLIHSSYIFQYKSQIKPTHSYTKDTFSSTFWSYSKGKSSRMRDHFFGLNFWRLISFQVKILKNNKRWTTLWKCGLTRQDSKIQDGHHQNMSNLPFTYFVFLF
jgi:hypothetical protein